ncbi:hypothetical protein B0H16DRAFT_1471850 [Mycena metata]|uniref:Uncharacterized protein n=1 Tax=Mycena metata TaxID=1033252 RepID=A0AAD7HQZ2_9AGAR|nr:hypothetical protein B0H16DRAFT_1471850 [Mycena metata]
MSTPTVAPSSKRKKRSLKPLPPRSIATIPDGARRPRPPPCVPTPPTTSPPSPSWVAGWGALFQELQQNLEQDVEREEQQAVHAGQVSMDSGNVDGAEDDAPERNVVYVEGSEEQLAARANFEVLLKEPLRTGQEYQANWDLAPWRANVDPAKRKAMIAARIGKINAVSDEDH